MVLFVLRIKLAGVLVVGVFIAYVQLVPKFRMSGSLSLLPLCAFMACTEAPTHTFSPGHYSRSEGRNSEFETYNKFSNIFH